MIFICIKLTFNKSNTHSHLGNDLHLVNKIGCQVLCLVSHKSDQLLVDVIEAWQKTLMDGRTVQKEHAVLRDEVAVKVTHFL